MKSLLSAMLVGLAACSGQGAAPAGAGLDAYVFSKASVDGNLGIYFLKLKGASQDDGGCLTLEEALKSGALKVTEKSEGAEVNELSVENSGERPVYLQAGDTVKGGQQDRTIAVDVMLPPRSGKRSVDAFCVEPGRWNSRDQSAGLAFSPSTAAVASKEQKLAIRLDKNQEKVWAAGEKVNKGLVRSGGASLAGATFTLDEPKNSYVLAAEDPAVAAKLKAGLGLLEKAAAEHPDAVGAAFCVNGRIQSIEVYGTAGLFRKLWPKLLKSAVLEALSSSKEAGTGALPGEADLRKLLSGMSGKPGKAEPRADGHVVRVYEQEHAALFDTEADGKLLHRQLITK